MGVPSTLTMSLVTPCLSDSGSVAEASTSFMAEKKSSPTTSQTAL